MFPAERSELRRAYLESWRKAQRGESLTASEARLAEVVAEHPEYHAVVESGEAALEAEFPPEAGMTNPFLHMGLHVAVREQVAIDRPPGVREAHERLSAKLGRHAAEHAMLECLAETLWEAQCSGSAPDEGAYALCLRHLLK